MFLTRMIAIETHDMKFDFFLGTVDIPSSVDPCGTVASTNRTPLAIPQRTATWSSSVESIECPFDDNKSLFLSFARRPGSFNYIKTSKRICNTKLT